MYAWPSGTKSKEVEDRTAVENRLVSASEVAESHVYGPGVIMSPLTEGRGLGPGDVRLGHLYLSRVWGRHCRWFQLQLMYLATGV